MRPFADPRQVQPWLYDNSPLTSPAGSGESFAAGPLPGAPLQNLRLGEDDFLLDHLGLGFNLLYFAGSTTLDARMVALFDALRRIDPRLRVLVVGEEKAGATGADQYLRDRENHLAVAYGAKPGALYLVRPDRHVAGRWQRPDHELVTAALRRALGEPHEADT